MTKLKMKDGIHIFVKNLLLLFAKPKPKPKKTSIDATKYIIIAGVVVKLEQ